MKAILEARDLTMKFSGLLAVDHFSLSLGPHDLAGIIGPNGAGKTTVFNLLSGVYTPTSGKVFFQKEDITQKNQSQVAQRGLCRTFQNIRLFKDLTVFENILLAYHSKIPTSLWKNLLMSPQAKREEEIFKERAWELLKVFELDSQASLLAKNLPYGRQRRLELARALATGPQVLLLDEPAAGLNPRETQDLSDFLRWIRKEFELSILLIEHDMGLVMKVCEEISVMDQGRLIARGPPASIQEHPKVIEAYLGVAP